MDSNPAPLDGLTEADRQELRLLYQGSVADISLFTRQQWWVTNYALAIYAALLFIAYQPQDVTRAGWQQWHSWQSWLLVVLAWLVAVSGLAAVKKLQFSIVGARRRNERARMTFGRPFQEVWASPRQFDDVHRLLYLVMLLSAVVVTLLVVAKP